MQDEEADATKEGSKYRSFSVLSREDGDVACWGVHLSTPIVSGLRIFSQTLVEYGHSLSDRNSMGRTED